MVIQEERSLSVVTWFWSHIFLFHNLILLLCTEFLPNKRQLQRSEKTSLGKTGAALGNVSST